MVTRHFVSVLMGLVGDLTYVYERTRSASEVTPTQSVSVKRQNYLLDVLKRSLITIQSINQNFNILHEIAVSINQWINYLNENYSADRGLFVKSNLIFKDAKELARDSQNWIQVIISEFDKPDTVLLQDSAMVTMRNELSNILDDIAKDDIKDGIDALRHNFPTPAVMILFRVAEHLLRRFYKKVIGKDAGKKTWGAMLKDLEQNEKVDKNLIGYLNYLNQKRIDATHPYRRYEQEEGERILLTIKDLINEIP